MCSVRYHLQDEGRPEDTHASAAWWKEAPQLQPVWILKQQSFSSENPHAGSQWREAFQLQTVQLLLHNNWYPQDTHANPFRSKAFQLQPV